MKLLFSPYVLPLKNNKGLQPGCLVKVQQGEFWGVADLCPRTELGDVDYRKQISDNRHLFRRCVELAKEDLNARTRNVSLLQDKNVRNNYLITDYHTTNLNRPAFDNKTLKIKGDGDIQALADKLAALNVNVRLRLDFNSKLSAEEFEKFLDSLSPKLFSMIDYVEDPTPYSEKWADWKLRVTLALDFQKGSGSYRRIIKPTREKIPAGVTDYTLTSAMDHPVGLAHGLRIAQQYAQNDSGFLTLDLYEESAFNKYYRQTESDLNFSESALNDTGIGMTVELEKLKWITEDEV